MVLLPALIPSFVSLPQYTHVVQTTGFNKLPAKGNIVVVRGKGGTQQVLREDGRACTVTEENRKSEIENNGDGFFFDLE